MCLQVAELKYKCLLISEETTVEDVIRYTVATFSNLEIRHLNFPLCQLMHPKSEYKYFRYFNIYLFSILQNYNLN